MSADLIDLPAAAPPRSEPVTIVIRQCLGGRWLLEMPAYWVRATFMGLEEALDFARRECCGAAAAIDLRFDGMICVIHQDRGWPKPICAGKRAGRVDPPAPARPAFADRVRGFARQWLGPGRRGEPTLGAKPL